MRISPLAVQALLYALVPLKIHSQTHEDECTHGKLYVTDNQSALIHVFDVSEGKLQDLTEETTMMLPSVGAGQLVYYGPPGDPLIVQYRGQEGLGYQDGFVRVINTGFSHDSHGDHGHVEYTDPSIVSNAIIDECARPIHQVRNDDKIAIFCDGSFSTDPQVNTTVHVLDETMLGSSGSAIVHSRVLQGTHHGVAIPVDDNHLLHSVALKDRVDRVPGTSSLPSTFQVVDYDGNILHELSDTSNPDTHCSGFHGSASVENTFVLACDDVHGGIVVVEYDPQGGGYTSRAITYPPDEKYDSFRIGSFAYHKNSHYIVGSYTVSGGTEFHLAAFSPSSTSIGESNILTLPSDSRQCAYQFEVGTGEHLLVLLPNGVLHVFEIADGSFTQVAKKEIVPNMSACSEATFTAGIGQAFVATPGTRSMYAIGLTHVEEGEIDVFESTLPFTPTAMTVSGFSYDAACTLEHDHAHAESSGVKTSHVFALLVIAGSVFF
ncbi:unnamed protein product [Cylindrotheca closterium]|uniref:Alkaline phosphatase n=1 Tax=Cylindrotheca closterium TaxID=2856 RepID=A0AAD2JLL1_9STRA|nr:unnamed protein product [Cylindrotheca closterium]